MIITILILISTITFFTLLIFVAMLANNLRISRISKKISMFKRDQDLNDIKIAQVLEAFNQCKESNKTMQWEMKNLNSNLEHFVANLKTAGK